MQPKIKTDPSKHRHTDNTQLSSCLCIPRSQSVSPNQRIEYLDGLSEGKAEQIGTPMELYEMPVTLFVAGVIGTPVMNLPPGKMQNGSMTLMGDCVIELPDRVSSVAGSKGITLGLRPETIQVGDSHAVKIEAQIDFVECFGADQLLHTRFRSEGASRLPVEDLVPDNGTLVLSTDPKHLCLFDSQFGHRF